MRKLITTIAKRVRRLLPGATDEGVWCAVANVAATKTVPDGLSEKRIGIKHFSVGTLVYCPTVLWGDGYENIKVVARHRGSHRFVTMVIRSSCLTNWRVKMVYSPHVISEFRKMGAKWDRSGKSKRLAQKLVKEMQTRADTVKT